MQDNTILSKNKLLKNLEEGHNVRVERVRARIGEEEW